MSYIFKHYARVEPASATGVHFVAYRIPIYNITYNLTNLESDSTNPTTIGENESVTIIITAPTGYNLPSDITVTGCTYTWEASTGMLDISNATGDIEITAEGVAETYPVTVNLTNVTGDVTNPTTVSYGGSAIFKFTADANYELPDGITQTGALSYNWNKSTGQLVLARIQGAVTITIVGESTLTQLATPTNVTIDGTTVSWDAVENATSYDIYVDGVLYENTTGGATVAHKLTWTDSNLGVTVDGVAVTSPYTLQDGDQIVVTENSGSYYNVIITAGTTTYDTDTTTSPITISSSDISLAVGTSTPSPGTVGGFTINYTA